MEEIESGIPLPNNSEYDPNHTVVATFNSISDVDNFCNTYNHDNGYNGLKIGQRVLLMGIYWYISGFDLESSNIASDGTSNNNGYGICLVPEDVYGEFAPFHSSNYENTGYISSTMHTSTLPTVANNLKNVLGDHLINRNVLLSSKAGVDNINRYCTAYTWTTAYCTLMSGCQLTGLMKSFCNVYDDGEANYKLPLFNYIDSCVSKKNFWIRGIRTATYSEGKLYYSAFYRSDIVMSGTGMSNGASFDSVSVSPNTSYYRIYVRPMIYIK